MMEGVVNKVVAKGLVLIVGGNNVVWLTAKGVVSSYPDGVVGTVVATSVNTFGDGVCEV